MKENSLSNSYVSGNSVTELVGIENFSRLSEENQRVAIDKVSTNVDSDGGYMGKIFGHKKENAAMNIAFILCVLLVIVGIVCSILKNDYWNAIIPALTTVLGYMFGKGDK